MSSVAKRPDIYLSELVNDLKELSGIMTNRVSVWRALKAKGFSHKKVCKDLC
jgi:transposase